MEKSAPFDARACAVRREALIKQILENYRQLDTAGKMEVALLVDHLCARPAHQIDSEGCNTA